MDLSVKRWRVGVVMGILIVTACTLVGPSSWTAAGDMSTGRTGHTATLLPDGRVLVTGGAQRDFNEVYASAELYDPETGTWTSTDRMRRPRMGHTATLLSDGRVLVAGGIADGNITRSAELYDPATGTWATIGSMAAERVDHVAFLLADGRVLVLGGAFERTAELYDPRTGTWSITGSPADTDPPSWPAAVLLADGTALVFGGGEVLSFDPTTGAWTRSQTVVPHAGRITATLLADGRVLVTGGTGDRYDAIPAASWYEPTTGDVSDAGDMGTGRDGHSATLLSDGRILVVGGVSEYGRADAEVASTELFDPATGTWTSAGDLTSPRFLHTATLLTDGTVLVVGGVGRGFGRASYLTSAELYDSDE